MSAHSETAFLAYADRVRPEIESALNQYSEYDDDCPTQLQDAIRHSLLAPGKRLRPLLVLIAAEACASTREAALPAACAVEMVHTYSLIHDDLPAMDDDMLRRGLPCCHVKFGEALAILAGDALLTQAFEVLAQDVQPAEVATRCCLELARAAGASAMVGGQVDDLYSERRAGDETLLERIHRRKTGAMFSVSLRLGGIIGGIEAVRRNALESYSRDLGLAFQIIDDLLDIEGTVSLLGKSTGKDARQAKLTFPSLLGVEESSQRAEMLIERACLALEPFGHSGACLESLARYILERNR